MSRDKHYITLDTNSLVNERKTVYKQKESFVFKLIILGDKIKLYISWVVWSLTHIIMSIFIPFFVSAHIFYEDKNFNGVQRPLILVSNHKKIFDLWFLSYAFPFKVLFGRIFPIRVYSSTIFSKENFTIRILRSLGIIKFIYFIYNTITIPETPLFNQKIAPLVNSIKKNQSILLFPEGKLTSDNSILEFKKGVVKIHELTKAPILPIALRYKKIFFPFYHIYVSIGKPINIPEELIEKGSENEFVDARNYLREKVLNLYNKTYNNKL